MYGSTILDGFDSRPLRETELHRRAARSGHALKCELTWIPVPMLDDDETETVDSIPVLLPSDLDSCMQHKSETIPIDIHNLTIQTNHIIRAQARSLLEADFYTTMVPDDVRELETYWRKTTQDLRVPLLEGRPDLYRRCIPVAIWGDEGSLNRSSWMLASWSLVYTYRIQTQDPLNPKP